MESVLTDLNPILQLLVVMTVFSFLPFVFTCMTSFLRFIIVFSILKTALGTQQVPPGIVITGLCMILTIYTMQPTFQQMYDAGQKPYARGDMVGALVEGSRPLKEFMLKQTRQDDLNVFAKLYNKPIASKEEVPMTVLIPAFAISEIKTGFLIGFLIYLPFIAIDFAVASILTSLGMVMISPMMFSLPLKLVIFALADGWALLAASLVESYKVF